MILTAGFLAGIVLADHAALASPGWSRLAWLALGLALVPRWALAGLMLLALAVGGLSLSRELERAREHELKAELRVVCEGSVESATPVPGGVRIVLGDVQGEPPLQLPERVELRVAAEPPSALARAVPGERWRLRARLRPPRTRYNPGTAFDAARLRRRGIGGVGVPARPLLAVRLVEGEHGTPFTALSRARSRAAARLRAQGRGGALLGAIGLGDRAALPAPVRRSFATLGLAHLLAVSGLHLALGAALGYAVARRLLGRVPGLAGRVDVRGPALTLALAGAALQALLSGFGVPVRRAWLLLLVTAIAVGRARPTLRREALALAALVVVAGDPAALFEVGTQLSFAASAALLLGVRAAPARGRAAWLAAALWSTATAGLATAPLVARAWGSVAPMGLLANLVGVPWTAGVLLPSALAASLVALGPEGTAGETLLWLATGPATLTLDLVERAAAVAPSVPPGGSPPTGWWLAATGVALAGLTGGTRRRVLGWVVVVTLLAVAPPRPLEPPPPRLVVLDVGHGDAVVVQGRDAAVLVDGALALSEGPDLGERSVLPALRALGIGGLDLVIATHADLDHRGGLPAVLRGLPVASLWLPWASLGDPGFTTLRDVAAARGVRVREQGAGGPPARLGDLLVEPLWPPREAVATSRNDRSLVVRVSARSGVILAGDLGPSAERELVRSADLRADVLLLPHHGSRFSTTGDLLAAVDPLVAVVSTPCGGRFRHPHAEVRQRVRASALPLWWTGRDGAVVVGLGERPVVRALGPVAARCWADAGTVGEPW